MRGWLNYWRTVQSRVTWDRSVARGSWIVPWLHWRLRRGCPRQRGTIAFYPQPAGPWYTIKLAMAATGLGGARNFETADAVMIFDDQTRSEVQLPNTSAPLLNARATDISKAHVGRVFERVFGYPLSLDPKTHQGPMVQKSDENGVHDGCIVNGPLEDPLSDRIYQHVVDSQVREGVTEDLRTVCVGGQIAQVFRKEKATESRFKAIYLETTLRDPEESFSLEEREKIAAFCDAIGLDFGSLDILRDYSQDGRLYIVDVNKTCMPVLSMPAADLEIGLRRIGAALEALILGPGT